MRILSLFLLCLLMVACSGKVRVEYLEGSNPDPSGVLVQVPKVQPVRIAMLDGEGGLNTSEFEMSLLDKGKFMDLSFRAPFWGTSSMKLELHPNGSLKSYTVENDPMVDEAIGQLTDTLKEVELTRAAIDEANKVEPEAEVDKAEELKSEILVSMLEANKEAIDKGEPLPYPELHGITPPSN